MKFQVSRVFRVICMVLLCLMLLVLPISLALGTPPMPVVPLAALLVVMPTLVVQFVRRGQARFSYCNFRSWVLVRLMRTNSSIYLYLKITARSINRFTSDMVAQVNRVIKIPMYGFGY